LPTLIGWIECPGFGDQADVSEPVMCAEGSPSVVELENTELDLWSGPFGGISREDSEELDEETAVVDLNIELCVCPPELTIVKGDNSSWVDVERDTSGDLEFVDPSSEVFETELCEIWVLFPLMVRCVDVEFKDNELISETLAVDRTEGEDVRSLSLEAFVVEPCVLELLLQIAVLCVSVEFGGIDLISDDVVLDKTVEENAIDSFLEVFGTRLSVLDFLLAVIVELTILELEDTNAVRDSVELVTVWGEVIGSTLPEVFGTRLCELELLLAVVVKFPSVELDPIFGKVELAITGDADISITSLEALETRLWLVELLLLVTMGCTDVEMNAGGSVVESATAADVCTAFEEENVVVVECGDGIDSLDFEVAGIAVVVLDVLLESRVGVRPVNKQINLTNQFGSW
jgi:hypothetical protein